MGNCCETPAAVPPVRPTAQPQPQLPAAQQPAAQQPAAQQPAAQQPPLRESHCVSPIARVPLRKSHCASPIARAPLREPHCASPIARAPLCELSPDFSHCLPSFSSELLIAGGSSLRGGASLRGASSLSPPPGPSPTSPIPHLPRPATKSVAHSGGSGRLVNAFSRVVGEGRFGRLTSHFPCPPTSPNPPPPPPLPSPIPLPSPADAPGSLREFTTAEMVAATSNFARVVGEGGFGRVYHGRLTHPAGPGGREVEVAVKVMAAEHITGGMSSFQVGEASFQVGV
ncbi:unnamed protein product [Closterium sp. NIES-54]